MILRPGRLLGGVARGGGRILVAPGVLSGLTFTRSQAGGISSTSLGVDGTTWAEFGADVVRYYGAAQRFLIEGQRTNGNRNPRCEGLIPGDVAAGGSLPTYFSIVTDGGLTTTAISSVVEDGVDLMVLRFSGIASGTQYILQTEVATQIAATPSQVVGLGWHARIVDATLPPIAHSTRGSSKNALGANITSSTEVFTPSSVLQRFGRSVTLSSNAGTSFVTLDYRFSLTIGAAYDFMMALGWFQTEGLFPSSPILPPVGTPGASTRGADFATAALSGFGIPASGACTLLWSGMLPQAAPATANQTLFQIDDGTANNAVFARNSAGGSTIVVARALAGVVVASSSAGSMVAGAPFRYGVTIDGSGSASLSLDGAAPVSVSGGPTSGLTRLLLGADRTGQQMYGQTARFELLPYSVPSAALPTLVANFPA